MVVLQHIFWELSVLPYHCISQVKEISMIQLNMTMLWVTGITCIVIGLVAIYASYKGWLK